MVSWILIGLVFLDWLATVILTRAARREREPALDERATVSAALTIGATGAAVLAAAFLLNVKLTDALAFVLIAAALLILSLPQLLWLASYWAGRFR